MSLDVAYSYCINLTEEKKLEMDKQVRKNRFEVKFAIFFPFLPFLMPSVPFVPVTAFNIPNVVRNVREKVQAIIDEKQSSLAQSAGNCEEANNGYKVYHNISRTLSKVSKKVRLDEDTSKGLDNLKEELKMGNFKVGRGSVKLAGTKTVYYMRSGGQARLFFKYSDQEKNTVEIIAEADKATEQEVIDNLRKNYK